MSIYLYTHICMYVCMHIYVLDPSRMAALSGWHDEVRIFVYIYIYTYIYIYILYIYIYIEREREREIYIDLSLSLYTWALLLWARILDPSRMAALSGWHDEVTIYVYIYICVDLFLNISILIYVYLYISMHVCMHIYVLHPSRMADLSGWHDEVGLTISLYIYI